MVRRGDSGEATAARLLAAERRFVRYTLAEPGPNSGWYSVLIPPIVITNSSKPAVSELYHKIRSAFSVENSGTQLVSTDFTDFKNWRDIQHSGSGNTGAKAVEIEGVSVA